MACMPSAATDTVRANERIGKLLLRLAAEKVAAAVRIFKEDGHVPEELMEERRPFYQKQFFKHFFTFKENFHELV